MNPIASRFLKMLNRRPTVDRVPQVARQARLARIIHQTFPSKTLPPELQQSVDSLQAMNPAWRHVLYDDDDIACFIREHYGETMLASYERIDPTYGAARADLFRYLLLYRQGGVYLDIKSAALRPLDDVLPPDEQFVIAQWPTGPEAKLVGAGGHSEISHIHGGEFQQWFVVSVAGHPFLKAVIETVLRNLDVYNPALHGIGKAGVLRVTGPITYTHAIAPLLAGEPHRRVDAARDLGFEYSLYPTANRGEQPHLELFKAHYSRATASIVRMEGLQAVLTRGLLVVRRLALHTRSLIRRGAPARGA